jgi:hypothetical protein
MTGSTPKICMRRANANLQTRIVGQITRQGQIIRVLEKNWLMIRTLLSVRAPIQGVDIWRDYLICVGLFDLGWII